MSTRHSCLERVNEKGVSGIWRCKCGARGSLSELPAIACTAAPPTAEDLLAVIEGPRARGDA